MRLSGRGAWRQPASCPAVRRRFEQAHPRSAPERSSPRTRSRRASGRAGWRRCCLISARHRGPAPPPSALSSTTCFMRATGRGGCLRTTPAASFGRSRATVRFDCFSISLRSGGGPHLGRAARPAQLRVSSQLCEAGQAGLSALLHGQHRNRRQPAQWCEGALRDLSGAARQRRLRMAGRRRDLVGRGAQLPPGGATHHPVRARPLPGPDRLQSRREGRLQRFRPPVYWRG